MLPMPLFPISFILRSRIWRGLKEKVKENSIVAENRHG